MPVVIVLAEKIRRGTLTVTANERATAFGYAWVVLKVPQRRGPLETAVVERGKPCEQVTQILVGALHDGNELIMGANWLTVRR